MNGAPALLSLGPAAEPRGGLLPGLGRTEEDNDFFYLTGLETPDAWLALNFGGEGGAVLYLRPRSPSVGAVDGGVIGPGPKAQAIPASRMSGPPMTCRRTWHGGSLRAHGRATSGGMLHLSLGDGRDVEALDALFPQGTPETRSLDPILGGLRLVKDEDELKAPEDPAARISMEAHRGVWRMAEPGVADSRRKPPWSMCSGSWERSGLGFRLSSDPVQTV